MSKDRKRPKLPFLPWWTDDYFEDTSDLEAHEHGLYLVLIAVEWHRPDCEIPDDMVELRRVMSSRIRTLSPQRFAATVPALLKRFFKVNPATGQWYSPRLKKERADAEQRVELARRAANIRHGNRTAETGLLPLQVGACPQMDLAPSPDLSPHQASEQRTPRTNNINGLADADAPADAHADAMHPTRTYTERKKDFLNGNGAERPGDTEHEPQPRAYDPDTVTEQNPQVRLQKFQIWLAPKVAGGWLTIAKAFDPACEDHNMALRSCKLAARNNGKGWPIQAPQ